MLHARSGFGIWLSYHLSQFFFVVVSSEEHRPKETSVNRALIDHDGILLIISRIRRDGHNGVATRW